MTEEEKATEAPVEEVTFTRPDTPPSTDRGTLVPNKLKGIDIEAEYALIQEKKSKLPAMTRSFLVHFYEHHMHGTCDGSGHGTTT
jgi:hypothetical protein